MSPQLTRSVSHRFAVFISLLVILGFCPSFSLEMLMTDEHRTKVSAAILTGQVISAKFVQELEIGALWRTAFKVDTVHKADQTIGTNTVIYFEQMYSGPVGKNGFSVHGRACPLYPDIKPLQKAKVWCVRTTIGSHTNVLFIPSHQWIDSQ